MPFAVLLLSAGARVFPPKRPHLPFRVPRLDRFRRGINRPTITPTFEGGRSRGFAAAPGENPRAVRSCRSCELPTGRCCHGLCLLQVFGDLLAHAISLRSSACRTRLAQPFAHPVLRSNGRPAIASSASGSRSRLQSAHGVYGDVEMIATCAAIFPDAQMHGAPSSSPALQRLKGLMPSQSDLLEGMNRV